MEDELLAHRRPLRSLTAEDHHHRRSPGRSLCCAGNSNKAAVGLNDGEGAVREMLTSQCTCVGNVRYFPRAQTNTLLELLELGCQRRFCASRKEQELSWRADARLAVAELKGLIFGGGVPSL